MVMSAETLRLLEVNRTRKRRCTGADWLAMWGFVCFVALVTNSGHNVPAPLSGSPCKIRLYVRQ